MSESQYIIHHSDKADPNNLVGQDDITAALAVLQRLAEKTSHPIVRSCLEQAYDDIVHLTSHGEEQREDEDEFAEADDS